MCWSWGVFLWSTRGHARDEDPRPSHSPIPRLARFSLVARRRCQVLVCTRCEAALRASANAACEPLRPDAPVREPGHSGWLALSDLPFALPIFCFAARAGTRATKTQDHPIAPYLA